MRNRIVGFMVVMLLIPLVMGQAKSGCMGDTGEFDASISEEGGVEEGLAESTPGLITHEILQPGGFESAKPMVVACPANEALDGKIQCDEPGDEGMVLCYGESDTAKANPVECFLEVGEGGLEVPSDFVASVPLAARIIPTTARTYYLFDYRRMTETVKALEEDPAAMQSLQNFFDVLTAAVDPIVILGPLGLEGLQTVDSVAIACNLGTPPFATPWSFAPLAVAYSVCEDIAVIYSLKEKVEGLMPAVAAAFPSSAEVGNGIYELATGIKGTQVGQTIIVGNEGPADFFNAAMSQAQDATPDVIKSLETQGGEGQIVENYMELAPAAMYFYTTKEFAQLSPVQGKRHAALFTLLMPMQLLSFIGDTDYYALAFDVSVHSATSAALDKFVKLGGGLYDVEHRQLAAAETSMQLEGFVKSVETFWNLMANIYNSIWIAYETGVYDGAAVTYAASWVKGAILSMNSAIWAKTGGRAFDPAKCQKHPMMPGMIVCQDNLLSYWDCSCVTGADASNLADCDPTKPINMGRCTKQGVADPDDPGNYFLFWF